MEELTQRLQQLETQVDQFNISLIYFRYLWSISTNVRGDPHLLMLTCVPSRSQRTSPFISTSQLFDLTPPLLPWSLMSDSYLIDGALTKDSIQHSIAHTPVLCHDPSKCVMITCNSQFTSCIDIERKNNHTLFVIDDPITAILNVHVSSTLFLLFDLLTASAPRHDSCVSFTSKDLKTQDDKV